LAGTNCRGVVGSSGNLFLKGYKSLLQIKGKAKDSRIRGVGEERIRGVEKRRVQGVEDSRGQVVLLVSFFKT
jgi:hypothetical protein